VVAEALEGLDSVRAVSVDLDDDRFDIRFVRGEVEADELAAVITDLGYRAEVLAAAVPPVSESSDAVRSQNIFRASDPELVRLLERAREAGKPLLLDVYTPG
jgi:copper chaperone CopZ